MCAPTGKRAQWHQVAVSFASLARWLSPAVSLWQPSAETRDWGQEYLQILFFCFQQCNFYLTIIKINQLRYILIFDFHSQSYVLAKNRLINSDLSNHMTDGIKTHVDIWISLWGHNHCPRIKKKKLVKEICCCCVATFTSGKKTTIQLRVMVRMRHLLLTRLRSDCAGINEGTCSRLWGGREAARVWLKSLSSVWTIYWVYNKKSARVKCRTNVITVT